MGWEGQSGRQRDAERQLARDRQLMKKRRGRERERFRKEEICKDKRWNKVTQRHKERKVLT